MQAEQQPGRRGHFRRPDSPPRITSTVEPPQLDVEFSVPTGRENPAGVGRHSVAEFDAAGTRGRPRTTEGVTMELPPKLQADVEDGMVADQVIRDKRREEVDLFVKRCDAEHFPTE